MSMTKILGEEMETIEDILVDKITRMINYALSKFIKPDITIECVTQLNSEEIENLKTKYGIEGVILDVDDTLRKNMGNIPKCNREWIENLRGKLKIVILSNGIDRRIESYFQEIGIDYIGLAHKPLKKNFKKACKKMNLSPDKVLVIGDSVIDDIYGGKSSGMITLLVKNVEKKYSER